MWLDSRIFDLARQLAFSPVEKKREQVTAACELLQQISPVEQYPWDFVVFRLTGFRPRQTDDVPILGRVLIADLGELIEYLSDALELRTSEVNEPVLSQDEVTRRFKVSSKTIQRWRTKGLIAQRYVFSDGTRRLGFRTSCVEHFARKNAMHIDSAARFRQLTDEDRQWIIRRARRLVERCGCNLKTVARRISRRMVRSPETIRYVIRKHDRTHPDMAIFPDATGPLRTQDRQIITNCFDRGVSVPNLAHRYGRTRSSIYRVVGLEKAQRIKNSPINFVDNALFQLPDAQAVILGTLAQEARHAAAAITLIGSPADADVDSEPWRRLPQGLPPHLADMFRPDPMPEPLVLDAFRRMNYFKYRARQLQQNLDLTTTRSSEISEVEGLLAQAASIKNQLVHNFLRVVVYVARKHQRYGKDVSELVSDGTLWLLRAIDTYDFSRGVKFSTYLSYSLMKNYARRRTEQIGLADQRLVTGQEQLLESIDNNDADAVPESVDQLLMQGQAVKAMRSLPPREREVLTAHFGLDPARASMSLGQLAEKMGVTKSRVRQVETRALRRLRRALEERSMPAAMQAV